MGRTYLSEAAEKEANQIGLEFAHSKDVMKDMSRAYHVDFSNIKVHTDSAADSKVKAAGKDALAQGKDLFFGKGIFESSDPADKGLVAHELAHTMQQGAVGGEVAAVAESAPMGVAQGGVKDWFKRHFTSKGRAQRRAEKTPMQDMHAAISGIFAGAGEAPQMAPNARSIQTISHEEFQHQKNAEALRNIFAAIQDTSIGLPAAQPKENDGAGMWTLPEEDLFDRFTSEEILRMERALGVSLTWNGHRFKTPK